LLSSCWDVDVGIYPHEVYVRRGSCSIFGSRKQLYSCGHVRLLFDDVIEDDCEKVVEKNHHTDPDGFVQICGMLRNNLIDDSVITGPISCADYPQRHSFVHRVQLHEISSLFPHRAERLHASAVSRLL
jgi:hypothetical protein